MFKLFAVCLCVFVSGMLNVSAGTVFEDDFKTSSLKKWKHIWPAGAWSAKEGELKNTKGGGGISVKTVFPAQSIVSFYISKGNKLKADHYCGIKIFIKPSGYVMLMLRPAGARYYSSSTKKEVVFKKSPKLENNRWYRVTVWLTNGKAEVAIDGIKLGAIKGKIEPKALQIFCRNQSISIKDFCIITDDEE
jgi:hypothetical protein